MQVVSFRLPPPHRTENRHTSVLNIQAKQSGAYGGKVKSPCVRNGIPHRQCIGIKSAGVCPVSEAKVRESSRVSVETHERRPVSGNPDIALIVTRDVPDAEVHFDTLMRRDSRDRRSGRRYGKFGTVEAAKTIKLRVIDADAVLRAEPEPGGRVLPDGKVAIAAGRAGQVRVVTVSLDCLAVVTVEPILSANPDEATAVLKYAVGHALREPVIDAERFHAIGHCSQPERLRDGKEHSHGNGCHDLWYNNSECQDFGCLRHGFFEIMDCELWCLRCQI